VSTLPSTTVGLGLVYRHSLVRVEANLGVPLVQTRKNGVSTHAGTGEEREIRRTGSDQFARIEPHMPLPSTTVGLGLVYRHSLVRVEANLGVPLVQTRGEFASVRKNGVSTHAGTGEEREIRRTGSDQFARIEHSRRSCRLCRRRRSDSGSCTGTRSFASKPTWGFRYQYTQERERGDREREKASAEWRTGSDQFARIEPHMAHPVPGPGALAQWGDEGDRGRKLVEQ
jgi:hypothetical protein